MDTLDCVDMGVGADKPKGTRARKRAAKPPSDTPMRSLNLRIDEETYVRLSLHALDRRTTISKLVMDYAKAQLRDVYLGRRKGPEGGGDVAE